MISRIILPLSVLATLSVAGWLYGRKEHRTVHAGSPEAIRLPWAISVLFGNPRPDGVCNVRGVLLQGFIYMTIPIFTLMVLGMVSHNTVIWWMGITSIVGVVLGIMHSIARRGS